MRKVMSVVLLVAGLTGLGGCVVAPAPGYYARPSVGVYGGAPRPYYRPYRRW